MATFLKPFLHFFQFQLSTIFFANGKTKANLNWNENLQSNWPSTTLKMKAKCLKSFQPKFIRVRLLSYKCWTFFEKYWLKIPLLLTKMSCLNSSYKCYKKSSSRDLKVKTFLIFLSKVFVQEKVYHLKIQKTSLEKYNWISWFKKIGIFRFQISDSTF